MAEGSRKVALAVTGSIAAYKAAIVARRLLDQGVKVVPVMTSSATKFLAPLTLSGICGVPVVREMFDDGYPGEVHVELGKSVDLVLIAPATADVLARLAHGRADDIVAALALSAECPVLAAPAMHSRMWNHPATQRNVATLRADGRVAFVGPVTGALASGESGVGRMAEPEDIAKAALAMLGRTGDLAGLRVVVTAGPTVEDIDPVRFVSNRSSGRMGFAVAERAASRGAQVKLIAGPVDLATPRGVERIDVRSARQMQAALDAAFGHDLERADVLVMSAAVADYTPREPQPHKMKKAGDAITLELTRNPDLLAEIGAVRSGPRPVLVGFAVETADDDVLVAYAQKKLRDKKVDMVVANRADDSFGSATNRATFVTEDSTTPLAVMSKTDLADRILDHVRALSIARGILSC
jgi:phosphopantothenoylcysteine decarboxylase/phosphopantothenate--cysteine ligase